MQASILAHHAEVAIQGQPKNPKRMTKETFSAMPTAVLVQENFGRPSEAGVIRNIPEETATSKERKLDFFRKEVDHLHSDGE